VAGWAGPSADVDTRGGEEKKNTSSYRESNSGRSAQTLVNTLTDLESILCFVPTLHVAVVSRLQFRFTP